MDANGREEKPDHTGIFPRAEMSTKFGLSNSFARPSVYVGSIVFEFSTEDASPADFVRRRDFAAGHFVADRLSVQGGL
ncbi:MAG TPA: hypothetical protein PLD20_27815 [Blastocatellia bacterium]|nr:hypothetical protein [Blastocatellia bacterium]HMX27715.1 hypothetical protein [Blastocatellia bacterium]HMY73546.1 hypothetical protein [Blastocatellia bacterium]HMZ21770.1 hypothetical protein [Blastocatellia bacterium]HNG31774.1 hypothetical protein [Blastocatellia bacterium]